MAHESGASLLWEAMALLMGARQRLHHHMGSEAWLMMAEQSGKMMEEERERACLWRLGWRRGAREVGEGDCWRVILLATAAYGLVAARSCM